MQHVSPGDGLSQGSDKAHTSGGPDNDRLFSDLTDLLPPQSFSGLQPNPPPSASSVIITQQNQWEMLEPLRDYRYFHRGFKRHDASMVKQNDIVISEGQLYTAGLGSCSAIALSAGGKQLLGHIDASTSPDRIAETIESNYDLDALRESPDSKIYLWSGSMYGTHRALNNIFVALNQLGLADKVSYLGDVSSHMTKVGIGANGTFAEDPTSNHFR